MQCLFSKIKRNVNSEYLINLKTRTTESLFGLVFAWSQLEPRATVHFYFGSTVTVFSFCRRRISTFGTPHYWNRIKAIYGKEELLIYRSYLNDMVVHWMWWQSCRVNILCVENIASRQRLTFIVHKYVTKNKKYNEAFHSDPKNEAREKNLKLKHKIDRIYWTSYNSHFGYIYYCGWNNDKIHAFQPFNGRLIVWRNCKALQLRFITLLLFYRRTMFLFCLQVDTFDRIQATF